MKKIIDRYNDLLDSYMTEENASTLFETARENMDTISDYVTAGAMLGLKIQFREIDPETFLQESRALHSAVRDAVIQMDKECLRMGLPLFYGLDYNNSDDLRDFAAAVFNELMEEAQSLLSAPR